MPANWIHAATLACVALGALPARAAVGDNSVGMNLHYGYPSFVDAAADLGVAWVRMDGNWMDMNPSSGTYAFASMDLAVDRAVAKGLKVFLTLGYTPGWVPHHGNSAECSGAGGQGKCAPNASTEWVAFVKAAVAHYRPRGVTHFGLWNEANLGGFWDASLDEYVNLIVKPGAAAVRSACATIGGTAYGDCKVLGPDLANVGPSDDALDQILAGAPGAFDIVTHHSYNGFSELGTSFYDGDRFPEVLDSQRCVPPFWCGRRSLRQVLDENGWSGEVWLTETGLAYRDGSGTSSCNPTYPNCASSDPLCDDEAKQARYFELVLGEQLSRPWYTNTFFYEIQDCRPDQPTCDIDGFGILRATAGDLGTRRFPDDVCRKDAFFALKAYIANHPEIVGRQPMAQCADGADNDGDGLKDLDDPGCKDGADADESDHPPRKQLQAYRQAGVVVDGTHDEWGLSGWLGDADTTWVGFAALSGASDLSVRAAARWETGKLLLAFDVADDAHDNAKAPADLWQGDSVQVAFDVHEDSGVGYDSVDDHEINFALVGGTASVFRFKGPAGATSAPAASVVRAGGRTRYEIALTNAEVPGITWSEGAKIGFSFLVNDADGSGREGWREFTPGIGMRKAPAFFGEIVLRGAPPGGVPDAGTAAPRDAATPADAAARNDGAAPGPDASPTGADTGAVFPGQDAAAAGIDGAVVAGPDAGGSTASGACGCSTSSLPILWVALSVVALRRRRSA